ncbi:hypothetical protein SUGI_0898040 [Cryptomeria japonica]|nr:hypothetical protein SUGI_0898040 [Cryptomeria japonica]
MAFYVRGLKLVFTVIVLSALIFQVIEVNGAPAAAPSNHAHAPISLAAAAPSSHAAAPTSHGVVIKENMNGYAFVLVGLLSALLVQAFQ